MEGFLLINKPAGVTSFGCVGRIRRLVGGKKAKVGHAGTLDKFATGLLIIGVGRGATRYLGSLLKLPKTYVATGRLGELTDTCDPTGAIVKTCDVEVSEKQLQNSLASFGDGYVQIPPIYSALKYQGQRLSDLSRNELGDLDVTKIAESKQRRINLYDLDLINFNYPRFTIKANVSTGTYVRSLVNDIADKVGSCATTVELDRFAIGDFSKDKALDLENLTTELIEQNLISVDEMVHLIS